MSVAFQLHTLAADDVQRMRQLLEVFSRAFESQDTYTGQPPSTNYLEALLRSEAFVAIAALSADTVVGGLTGYLLPKYEQQRSEFYIYDLAVDPAYQRKGVATALLQYLQQMGYERGWSMIFVQAEAGDAPAIGLYSKFGIQLEALQFDIAPVATSTSI